MCVCVFLNITCSVYILLPVCLLLGMTIWHWITSWWSIPVKITPSAPNSPQLPIVLCVELRSTWLCPIQFGVPISTLLLEKESLTDSSFCYFYCRRCPMSLQDPCASQSHTEVLGSWKEGWDYHTPLLYIHAKDSSSGPHASASSAWPPDPSLWSRTAFLNLMILFSTCLLLK